MFSFYGSKSNVCLASTFITSWVNVAPLAPHSPSAASSPTQEPPQAAAEDDQSAPCGTASQYHKTHELAKLLKGIFFSPVVVCVAFVTLVIMATLGFRAFIECRRQISEREQRQVMTNSDLTKLLTECNEEKSDIKQQLQNATFNLIAAINELKDVRKIVEQYGKITGHLKEKLGLIQHLHVTTRNSTSLLGKAVQNLKEAYDSMETEINQLNIENLRLREVVDNCTNWLNDGKQLKEENLKLQTINNSYVTLLIEENQLRTNLQNQQFYGISQTALETEMENMRVGNLELREVVDNCTNQLNDTIESLREEKIKLQTINNSYAPLLIEVDQLRINNQNLQVYAENYATLKTEMETLRKLADNCTTQLNETTKDLREETLKTQTINSSYTTLLSEANQLRTDIQDMQEFNQLSIEIQELKKVADNCTKVVTELSICTKTCHDLQAIVFNPKFSSIWDYCDNQTFKCAQCMPDWVEHSSRCFFLSTDQKEWLAARAECVRLGGDLARAPTLTDQEFLTTLVKNATVGQHGAAWIGASDLVEEDDFIWVDGMDVKKMYWKIERNETDSASRDCVAIVAPAKIGEGTWTHSWDDLICTIEHQYICETTALNDFENAPPP